MNLANNVVLITGGSSGIGLELSQRLSKNNKVIICGRSKDKLLEVKKKHPEIEIFQCDVSEQQQCHDLVKWIQKNHGQLNVLVNNAAIVHTSQFANDDEIVEKAEIEVNTNFIGPIRLIKLLSPILQKNTNPTIINVTTGLIYAPRSTYPFYNATKAALHSFTQVLRLQLAHTKFNIIEVMFPAVKTPWHKGEAPKIAITTEKAVNEMMKGLASDKVEIKVAKVKLLHLLSRFFPKTALRKINNLTND